MFDPPSGFHGEFADHADVHEPSPRQIHECEALIRQAGQYVRPGDQLRPRVLEAVLHRKQRRQAWRRCAGTLTLATSALLFLLVLGHIAMAIVPRGRSANDLHQQATARASSEGIAWEWALTEVIYDWRRSGSTRAVQTGYRQAETGSKKRSTLEQPGEPR